MKRELPPRRRPENGQYLCRGCGAPVPKGRQTWCSNECRETHYLALPTWARHRVHARDKGVCARCGVDTDKVHRILRWLRCENDLEAWRSYAALFNKRPGTWSYHVGHLWEADHTVPLAEGGSNSLENYRTLCVPCHKEVTRDLAGRLAARRREPRPDLEEVP